MQRRKLLPLAAAAFAAIHSTAHAAELNKVSILTEASVGKAAIEEAVSQYLGQEVSAKLLQNVLDQISRCYREGGYPAAQAFIPEQVMHDGVLQVRVIAPITGNMHVENYVGLLPATRKMLTYPLLEEVGKPANLDRIESHILKIRDLGLFKPEAWYTRGKDSDAHHLNVLFHHIRRYPFRVFMDNYGTKPSGVWRGGFEIARRNISHHADTLSFMAAGSTEKQADVALSYRIPVNSHPTVLGLGLSGTSYELAEEYEALGAKGYAISAVAFISEPLYRTRRAKVTMRAEGRWRDLRDKLDAFGIEFKKNESSGALALDTAYRDKEDSAWGTFEARFGQIRCRDDFSFGQCGGFSTFSMEGGAITQLKGAFSLRGDFAAQYSPDSLEGALRFKGGGPGRVTAVRQSSSGDSGVFASVGLPYTLNNDIYIGPHLDLAHTSSHDGDSATLSAFGLKLSIGGSGIFLDADVTAGRSTNDNDDRATLLVSFGYGLS
jgi:hemolysin activation/secretion protein